MKWTVLSDNRSNDNSLLTEHGLSILLQTGRHKILLDTGASDVFLRNAEQLGINLSDVDYVFISHGHSDHAGGLRYFMEQNTKAKVIVSPDAISGKFYSKRNYLHSITTVWPKSIKDRLITVEKTCEIVDGLYIITHIPQIHPMPKGNTHLFVKDTNGEYVNDDFRHELALYTDGFLFTGCAHSGLENILTTCPDHVNSVVGGFHLLDGQELPEQREPSSSIERPSRDGSRQSQSEEELQALAKRLKENYPSTQFYTSHCTGDKVFEIMKGVMGEQLQSFRCGTMNEMECVGLSEKPNHRTWLI